MIDRIGGRQFDHPAFVYSSVDEFLSYMTPFVAEGVDQGDNVFVAVGDEPLSALKDEIGSRAASVEWAATDQWHPNPARRLRAFHEMVTDCLEDSGRRSRLVGEPVWPAVANDLTLEWQRYEAVVNRILGPLPATLVCTYDSSRLNPDIVASAYQTHPVVNEHGLNHSSARFEHPEELLTRWIVPLAPPPEDALELSVGDNLSEARHFLRDRALEAGLHADQTMELLVAANEVLTNALTHGFGIQALRAWADQGYFVCEVEDAGTGIADPLAGYRTPSLDASMGRGLWMARQVVDLLQISVNPHGTTVRLRVRRNALRQH